MAVKMHKVALLEDEIQMKFNKKLADMFDRFTEL